MKKHLSLIMAAALACAGSLSAQSYPSPEAAVLLREDPTRAGNNTNSFEFRTLDYSAAPKGYKPFYISHMGRHGSRSNWGSSSYDYVIGALSRAKEAGLLTASGDSLLNEASRVKASYNDMDGHISPRGIREHAAIADRMMDSFPEVFKGEKSIRAISSTVARCAVSMSAFTNELCRRNPKLAISLDSHEKIDEWLNTTGPGSATKGADKLLADYRKGYPAVDTVTVMKRLFTDPSAAHEFIGRADAFQDAICSTASIAEDWDIEENMYRFVSFDAIYRFWSMSNRDLYLKHANSVEFGQARCEAASKVAADIVAKADEAINGGRYAADLRFGHDHPILGLVSYLGIEGVGDRLSFDQIDQSWFGFFNIPMASTLQLVFYKNKAGNVLVKVIYNEKECTLRGLEPVQGPYYSWDIVKANIAGYKRF